jgi:hypothetical protein
MDKVIDWLLEDNNPAVRYRTRAELLKDKANKSHVMDWVNTFIPGNWQEAQGLWYIYYLTALAECGLTNRDIAINKDKALAFYNGGPFEYNCGNFMQLRALIMLGFQDEPRVCSIIDNLSERQLADGGFLCLHRLDKLKYNPKSCVKSNNLALLFCAECKKRGIETKITDAFLLYFWKHHLFYRTGDLSALILKARDGYRTIDAFYPFEVMRVGLQNIVEAFCALGYGNDERLRDARDLLNSKKNNSGQVVLDGTLSKSYLPKERVGKPSKWATFYALLAEKEAQQYPSRE